MDGLRLSDPVARRVGRFFADLMVTLADGEAGAAESAEAISLLWRTGASEPAGLELDVERLVHGIGAVAVALADELVALRRAVGAPRATSPDVWAEVVGALEPGPLEEAGGGSVIDLT